MKCNLDKIKDFFPIRAEKVKNALVVFFIVGLAGFALPASRNLFIHLTPVAILLSSAVLAVFHRPVSGQRQYVVFMIVFIAGFFIEVAGVKTGFIFGNYAYGRGLGIKLFETPVLIGINWLFLIYSTNAMTDHLPFPVFLRIFASSLLMVAYDAVLEQAAPRLDMWSFEGPEAPFRNYLAWFAIAFALHSFVKFSGINYKNSFAAFVFTLQLVFFILLIITFNIN